MSIQLNLKEIERKAFRSTYQDGLWDIYLGLVVITMAIFIYRPAKGYSVMNILIALLTITLSYGVFWAGKKYITIRRMGQVTFGKMRKRKNTTLAIILAVFVLILVGLVVLTALGWADPVTISSFINERVKGLVIVATIGAFIVGASMIVCANFMDFPRGYYIAILMGVAVFLMITLNQPIYPIILGGLISIPGLVLFIRFLRKYPLHRKEASHE
jgi:hypothetical protein